MNNRTARLGWAMTVAATLTVGRWHSTASAADQAPKTHYEVPMPRAAFDSDLGHRTEAECNQLFHMLLDREMLIDPQRRAACLQTAKPILTQYAADFKALAATYPSMQRECDDMQDQTRERLALLGDAETAQALQADAAGGDPTKAAKASAMLVHNDWTMADGNAQRQSQVADQLESLDRKFPTSETLTALTLNLSAEATAPSLHERMIDIAVAMDTPKAKQGEELRAIRAAAKSVEQAVGHPFAVAGPTPDGKPFTTADWKGKVVVADFWATWCGPCKAALPGIKQLYADHHAGGLEIVGVSNDFDPDSLAKYTAANAMPWPQLFDADAAKRHTWNPVTLRNGITGIPRVFVIDRNGILLSTHAGESLKVLVEKALEQK